MKKFALVVALVAAFLFTVGTAKAQQTPGQTIIPPSGHTVNDFYRYIGPDLDLQGGVGYQWGVPTPSSSTFGMARLRGGLMWIPQYPWVFSAGATFEINSTTLPVWGAQVEVMNFGAGLWLRGGAGLDYSAHPHFNAAVGWSVVGVELSHFTAGPYDNREGVAVLATVRIPVGFILYVFQKH